MSRILHRIGLSFVTALLVLSVLAPTASAQQRQVAFDSNGTLFVIDAENRARLGLFPDVEGFVEAQLFRENDTTYELVLIVRDDGERVRTTRTLTRTEVEDLRARVDRKLKARQQTLPQERQDGRLLFLSSTTALSTTGATLLLIATEADSPEAASLPLSVGALGFFIPLVLTQDADVTQAEAVMMTYGGFQSYAYGFQIPYSFNADTDVRAASGISALLGPAGAIGGAALARRNNWSAGHAQMLAYTGFSGNFIGLGLSSLVTQDGEARTAASALGSVAGSYTGHLLGRSGQYTSGDTGVYLLTGVQTFNLATAFLFDSDLPSETNAATLTAAGVGGLALGTLLTRRPAFSEQDAGFIWLGSSTGAAFGAGLATSAEAGEDAVTILQALGGALGFGVTYGILRGDALKRAAGGGRSTSGLDVSITPSFGAASMPGMPAPQNAERELGSIRPMLNLKWSF